MSTTPSLSFTGLVIVMAVGFAAPLILGWFPMLRLPAVVLEIVLGIVIGPSVLKWVRVDPAIQVLSTLGLAFLLFMAGLEIELDRLRGRLLRLPVLGMVISLGLGVGTGFLLKGTGQVRSPFLIAIILMATSVGLVVPVLKDAGRATSDFGQLVIAGATVADFAAVILLTLFFSEKSSGLGSKLLLLGFFVLLLAVVGMSIAGVGRWMRLSDELIRLQDTTAQIRVRGAVLILLAFVALAAHFGLETILGAFLAGVILGAVDRGGMTHPHFRTKLEGISFGFLVPIFFVTSGLQFDLRALFKSESTILLMPIFLLALLLIRGIPALLYRRLLTVRETAAAALLQATSLPFIVVGAMLGRSLGLISAATSAAVIAAGLLSVLIFPLVALTFLRRGEAPPEGPTRMEERMAAASMEKM
jgi:Kef-type K+ transport system membrane component KefB